MKTALVTIPVSSVYGTISSIFVMLKPNGKALDGYSDMLMRYLAGAFGKRVEYYCLIVQAEGGECGEDFRESFPAPIRKKVNIHCTTLAVSDWAQDTLDVIEYDGRPVILVHQSSGLVDDIKVLFKGLEVKTVEKQIMGNNLFVTRDNDGNPLFIASEDLIDINESGREEMTREINNLYGEGGVIWIKAELLNRDRASIVGLAHLDMLITPIGKNEDGIETILVGKLEKVNTAIQDEAELDAIGNMLDEIADQLKSTSFKVERIPFLAVGIGPGTYFLLSYNNCLLEIPKKGKGTIYLPSYVRGNTLEIMPMKSMNKMLMDLAMFPIVEQWEKIYMPIESNLKKDLAKRFHVREMSDMYSWGERGGALHCMVKVIGRRQLKKK